ncbi:PREDICTED: cystatin-B-like [Pygoscelis adeliae]|uniref:cystatin-B-like n=1 Tax=Pygoscelis adeliae TaxID=9238 RepID=UPI0004F4D9F2|nr:PREDICTED: cystatin-B-like [Pygoscelis adeliae]
MAMAEHRSDSWAWQVLLLAQSGYSVKPQLEEKEGKTFDVFTAVEFKTQVVAGTNFFIKVHVGNDEFMHLRVFRSLPHDNKPLSLHSYQSSKTKHDELAFF